MTVETLPTHLTVHDTGGESDIYDMDLDGLIAKTDVVVLVYSMTERTSFQHVMRLLKRVRAIKDNEETPIIVVCNCIDESKAEVSVNEGEVYCRMVHVPYMEGAASDRLFCDAVFRQAIKLARNPESMHVPTPEEENAPVKRNKFRTVARSLLTLKRTGKGRTALPMDDKNDTQSAPVSPEVSEEEKALMILRRAMSAANSPMDKDTSNKPPRLSLRDIVQQAQASPSISTTRGRVETSKKKRTPRDVPALKPSFLSPRAAVESQAFHRQGYVPRALKHLYTVDDVCKWLKEVQCEDWVDLFRKHQVDGEALLLMSERDLVQVMGMPFGTAKKVFRRILELAHQVEAQEGNRGKGHRTHRKKSPRKATPTSARGTKSVSPRGAKPMRAQLQFASPPPVSPRAADTKGCIDELDSLLNELQG